MSQKIIYWGLVFILGTIHLYFLLSLLPFDVPVYITSIAVIAIIYFISKKHFLQISILGMGTNLFFFCTQLLLLLFYVSFNNSWFNIVHFILFCCLEIIRTIGAQKIASFQYALNEMTAQERHMNETFRIVRSERHEFMKHVSAIHFMLENEKNEQAKLYLNSLVDDYEETNLSIKGENGSVAAVLHQMYRTAKANGIEVIYDMDLPLSTLPLSDQDKVSLIGNLLSNSIDASIDWQNKRNEQATITLQFYKRSGLYLLICQNNSLPIPTPILDKLFHTYGKTTKTGKHEGLGTKIIHDIVHKHKGFLDFIHKDQEFLVKIKIPAIR